MHKNKGILNSSIRGFMWMFSSTGSQAVIQAVVLIILARLLDPVSFGIVSAALVVITFTNILTTIGIGPALIQRQELNIRHIQTGFSTTIILNCLLGFLIFLFSPTIADFFKIYELERVLKVLSSLFIVKGFGIVAEHLILRDLRFKLYSIVNACSYGVYGIVGVILATTEYGVWALVAAQISQELFKTTIFLIKYPHSKKLKISIKEFKELYSYGSGVSIAKVFNQIGTQGDNLIVGRFLGAEALGLYSRAYQLMIMPANLFGQVMDKVLFPALSKIQQQKERVLEWFITSITIVAIITMPISIFIALFSEEIVMILFGEQWLGIVLPLQILSVGLLFRTSYKISDSLIRAMGAVYRRAWRQAIYATSIIIFTYIGHFWGLKGISIGVFASIFINFLMMAHLSIKLLEQKMTLIFKIHLKPFLLSLILFIIVLSSKEVLKNYIISPILTVIIMGIVFIMSFIMLIILFPKLFLDKNIRDLKNRLIQNKLNLR